MLAILLPPSEGKATGGGRPRRPGSGQFRRLGDLRSQVAEALAACDGGDPKALGATGDLFERARRANRSLVNAPTLPAWQRFTGVVWEHLGPGSLDSEARERARTSVLVLSAVGGLSAWDDPLPDFRLKLSARLPGIGRLDRFWAEALTALLDEQLRGRTVVDLLPNEHRAPWTPSPQRYRLVRPVIRNPDGTPAGHAAKAAKGLLARALLEDEDVDRVLATFDPSVSGFPLTLGIS